MRLIYKLILLSVLPLLITVAVILYVNTTLTESTVRVGVERAALEEFESKTSLLRAYFDANLDMLRILGRQDEFRYSGIPKKLEMLEEWEGDFPGKLHRFYFFDGERIWTSAGDDAAWDTTALGLDTLAEEWVSGQMREPGGSTPLLVFWVRTPDGALGISRPLSELHARVDSLQEGGTQLTALVDAKGESYLQGPLVALFRESGGGAPLPGSLLESISGTTVGSFQYKLDGAGEFWVVAGLVPGSSWRLALLLDEEIFRETSAMLYNLNLLIVGLAIIPILLVAYAMNLALIRPINMLMGVQQELGQGNLSAHVEGLPQDEIGKLGHSFNMMASNLRALSTNLAASEERFRLLAENIPGVIYLCNNDREYSALYLNDAMESLSGYEKSDFLDNRVTIAKIILPEDRQCVYDEVDACLAERKPFHLVYRIRRRNGEVRWVEEFGTGVWDGEQLVFLEGVISDVTERKNAEESTRISESRYRALIEGANHPITIIGRDTKILLVNTVAARNLGLPATECIGKTLQELIPPMYEETLHRMDNSLKGGQIAAFEDRVELPGGVRWFWSFFQHIRLEEDPNAVLIMSYDITDRKRAEEALRYRLDFENLLADMSTNFINIEHRSIDHAIVDALAVLAQFIGCDGAYIFIFSENRDNANLTHSWHNGKFNALHTLLKGMPIRTMPGWREKTFKNQLNIENNIEHIFVKAADNRFISEDVGVRSFCEVPLIYQDQVLGVLGLCNRDVGHDWTEDEGLLLKFAGHVITNALQRKEAEESLMRYRDELERLVHERTQELEKTQEELVRKERLATLGQLTATVSHELRNPLGTIRGSFYTIAERTKGRNLNIERALDRVERNIVRCDTIIEELLDFTRSRSLELKQADPDAIVYDVVEDYPVPRNLHLEADLGVGCSMQLDVEKFRRCIINIINNACEAMRELANSTVCRAGSQITLHSSVVEGEYILCIEDNGPGIPAATMQKIFEPLYSTKGFGVGLGLTLVQQIVEQHGGNIKIESPTTGGARVTLRLPLQPRHEVTL